MSKNANLTRILMLLTFAVLYLPACNTASNTDIQTVPTIYSSQSQNISAKTETAENNSTQTANSEQLLNAGVCTNKYFPVSNGAKRRYKVAAGTKTDEYTYTVLHQSGADKFTQTQDISLGKATKLKIEWLCFPEGLRTAEYGQITGNPNIGMKLSSKGGSGITLPKDTDWRAGKKWISEYDLGGNFEMAPFKGAVTGKATLNHEILNMEEKVMVAGGEFVAAKVKTTISLTVTFQNKVLPSENIVMTNWYAPNVGLVKQEVTGTMGKMMMDYLGK